MASMMNSQPTYPPRYCQTCGKDFTTVTGYDADGRKTMMSLADGAGGTSAA